MFERQTVFSAPEEAYVTHRIPGLICTPNGVLIISVESRRPGENTDWTQNDLRLRRSLDGGRTWEAPTVLMASEAYGGGPMHNLCFIADRDEKCVHALFSHDYHRTFYIRSNDDGKTWTKPVDITAVYDPWRVAHFMDARAAGIGHSIQLSTGRMIVPVWVSKVPRPNHGPNRTGVIYSDDHGRTWRAGGLVPDTIACCNEAQPIQLADGRVLLNMRNQGEGRRRAMSISADGVYDWSEPRYEPALLDPQCHASMIRHRLPKEDGPGRMVYCGVGVLEPFHHNPELPWGHYRRELLTLRVSSDEGKTWPIARRLTTDPDVYAGYSDLAVLPDGTILCVYEYGGPNNITAHCNSTVVVARFDLEWLNANSAKGLFQ
jgi:sialidase-1